MPVRRSRKTNRKTRKSKKVKGGFVQAMIDKSVAQKIKAWCEQNEPGTDPSACFSANTSNVGHLLGKASISGVKEKLQKLQGGKRKTRKTKKSKKSKKARKSRKMRR